MPALENPVDAVLEYHSRTKHHLHRFAASLGYLDWASQPDPFRSFDGAQKTPLPLSAVRLAAVCYANLYQQGTVPVLPLNQDNVAALFELALGLSAWKQYQDTRWALRCNPSSGNLHPTEGYAILLECPDWMRRLSLSIPRPLAGATLRSGLLRRAASDLRRGAVLSRGALFDSLA
jgi:hypothetical protein